MAHEDILPANYFPLMFLAGQRKTWEFQFFTDGVLTTGLDAADFTAQIRRDAVSSAAELVADLSITVPSAGIVHVTIDETDSDVRLGRHAWDLVYDAGDGPIVCFAGPVYVPGALVSTGGS